MKKITLTENDIQNLVNKIINEMEDEYGKDKISQNVWTSLNRARFSDKADYLEKHGFAVYDDENEEDLNNAIIGMIHDGDITSDDIIMYFG